MSPLPARQKLSLIKRAQSGEKVARLCREVGVARKTFYQWLKKTSGARPQNQLLLLSDKRFKQLPSPKPLDPQDRLLLINKVANKENSVSALCRERRISRKTFYKWVERFNKAETPSVEALRDRRAVGENHWRFLGSEKEEMVLNYVAQNPQHSCRKIANAVPQISYHGIQSVLERHNLNTYERRLTYQQSLYPTATPVFVPPVAPTVFGPAKILRFLASPFETIPKLAFSSKTPKTFLSVFLLSFLLFGVFFQFGKLLSEASSGARVGLVFATISLTFGIFFFLYSLKYYFTLILILGFSRQVSGGNGGESGNGNGNGNGKGGIWQRIFGIASGGRHLPGVSQAQHYLEGAETKAGGLQPDLSHVILKRQPFVSIHLPLYNEKRVVDRLLTACTSQDYPHFEIIVADDSNDETLEVLKKWETHPKVKISHRETREGFKGGALGEALKVTNPRAEFILVFDSDFLPYPDTITQFLRYFQVTAGSLDFRQGKLSDVIARSETTKQSQEIATPLDKLGARNDNGSNVAAVQGYPSTSSGQASGSNIAAIQGYQWHVLNKSENWVTRGVRSEYAGSYVVERSAEEITGALKQIAGSVYMIRRDVLEHYGWGTSITEDFELTLKLYRDGFKVVYTPYIQTPSECVSTLKRLIRQRMRWAEGHSHNIKRMFWQLLRGRWETNTASVIASSQPSVIATPNEMRGKQSLSQATEIASSPRQGGPPRNDRGGRVWVPSKLTFMEKLEFLYLSPYYLQATFFILGTLSWFLSEAVFQTRLPFWTSIWGWSLVLTNLFSLPLMNTVGLFLEESEERDYGGILSFIFLTYLLVPFQGYAALKGFLEKEEGPWFRTPKTGKITDIFTPGRFTRFISGIFGRPAVAHANNIRMEIARMNANPSTNSGQVIRINSQNSNSYLISMGNPYLALSTANNRFDSFRLRPWRIRWAGKSVLALFLIIVIFLNYLTFFVPPTQASTRESAGKIEQQINIIDQISETTSTTDTPTDNSLGLVRWTSGSYTGATVYFEAIICNTGYSDKGGDHAQITTATLYTSGGSAVTGSPLTINQFGCSYSRQRSASITLTNGTDYTVRIKTDSGSATARVKSARLIIVQSVDSSTWLDKTETQVEVGNNENNTSGNYAQLTDKKIYYYDSSKFDPAPTVNFEASLKATMPTQKVEQQINIIDQTYSIDSLTYAPTDNSLGLIRWDGTKYNGATVYFEVLLSRIGEYNIIYAALFDKNGNQVNGSEISVYAGPSYARFRTSSGVTLNNGTDYTVRIKRDNIDNPGSTTVRIRAARLIIEQSASTITASQTQIEVGNNQTGFTNTTYSALTDYKIYQYDQGQFNPTSESSGDVEFHATLKIADLADTVYAELYNNTGSQPVAELSHTGDTNWTLKIGTNVDGDADWDTTNDDDYIVRIKCVDGNGGGCSGSIANARIVLYQSGTITALETVQQSINTLYQDSSGSYNTTREFLNRYNYLNFSLSGVIFEATLKTSGGGTGYAQLYKCDNSVNCNSSEAIDIPTASEVSTTGTSYVRQRSSDLKANTDWPTGADDMDGRAKGSSTTVSVSSAWIILQISLSITAYADLLECTDASCSGGSSLSGSEVSVASSTWTRQRTGSPITLTNGKNYTVRIKKSTFGGLGTAYIANAKIILTQSNGSGGVYKLETMQQLNNTKATDSDSTYTAQVYNNKMDKTNDWLGGTFTAYFETTIKTNSGSNAYFAEAKSGGSSITASERTGTSTSYTRDRDDTDIWSSLTDGQDTDVELKNASTSETASANSWLVIQVTDLQVPEKLLLFIPVILFLPKIVRWWKSKRDKMKVAHTNKLANLNYANLCEYGRAHLSRAKLQNHRRSF